MTAATERRAVSGLASGKGDANNVKSLVATHELAISTATSTIEWGKIPSNARILLSSRIYVDDLATSGSPTLDTGLKAVDGNLANADDPDALLNGLAIDVASSNTMLATGIENAGLPAWDLVASETSDPGGVLEVYSTVLDAPTTQAGTISIELYYTLD